MNFIGLLLFYCRLFENFKKEFETAGVSLFGSGWVLAKDATGQLFIDKCSNTKNPRTKGLASLLIFNVWKHSYYIDYQNCRAEYFTAIWKIIDCKIIDSRY